MFKDALGQQLEVGDFVAYATTGRYPRIYSGHIERFTPNMVKVSCNGAVVDSDRLIKTYNQEGVVSV